MAKPQINIEVACAFPNRQKVIPLQCKQGITLAEAVEKSGILDHFPELDTDQIQFGVYGLRQPPDFILSDTDRVEIYRPLIVSPTEARRLRAASGKFDRD